MPHMMQVRGAEPVGPCTDASSAAALAAAPASPTARGARAAAAIPPPLALCAPLVVARLPCTTVTVYRGEPRPNLYAHTPSLNHSRPSEMRARARAVRGPLLLSG